MRLQVIHLLLTWGTLLLLARAWTKEDHEIFRLRDEVEASEGHDVTFYDFVGVKSGASVDDINKAFRKKSRALHPDKVKHNFIAARSTAKPKQPGEKRKPGVHVSKGPSTGEINKFVKQATERYQRLGVVANILKGIDQRQRYDHFLNHGFPKWRGTGYYYTRYRPGLGTVLVGLFIVGGGAAHYGALIISYNRQREFMDKYIRSARKQAWGDDSGIRGIPGLNGPVDTPTPPPEEADSMANLNRRQKREMERQNRKPEKKSKAAPKAASKGRGLGTGEEADYGSSTTPVGSRRRVTAENGKTLLVDSIGNVFLQEEDEDGNVDEFLLDIDEIQKPTIRDTALVRLPVYLYRRAFDPFLQRTTPVVDTIIPEEKKIPQPSPPPAKKSSTPPLPATTHLSVTTEAPVRDLSASIEGFEVVDSTGLETEMNASATKKRGKKGKK